MTGTAGLHELLRELAQCSTPTAAANGLARVITQCCGTAYAAVYLRDYTGETLLLSGSAPHPVAEGHVTPKSIPVFDTNHPLAYCMHLGRSVTLPISVLSPGDSSDCQAGSSSIGSKEVPTKRHSDDKRNIPLASSDSFYPLIAPGEQTIGVLVIGHDPSFLQDKHDVAILCLYASAIINTAIIDQRNKAIVTSLNEDLQRYGKQEQEQQKLASIIIGTSPATEALRSFILRAAQTDASILITGETGTGKSLVAKNIHKHSHRKDKPFMEINCAAITPNLLESELFGHVKGAFSGAVNNSPGLFRAANGGTVFLDEIGELPASLQAALLHVVQEKTVRPVGSAQYHPIDIRLLAATNRSMPEALSEKAFRADLYHRLAELTIHISPLRERPEDIRVLCQHLFGILSKKYDRPQLKLSPKAIRALSLLRLEGNVRELSNILEQCLLVTPKTTTTVSEDAFYHLAHTHLAHEGEPCSQDIPLNKQLESVEASIISKAYVQCAGDIQRCARLLGIHAKTLTRRLNKYGIGTAQRRQLWN